MNDYDTEAWMEMCRQTIEKHVKHLESFNFWVTVDTLYDKQGNSFSQTFPNLAINFK